MNTEDKNLKNESSKGYNDTNKNPNEIDKLTQPKSECCGVTSIAGLHYKTQIIVAVCPECKHTGATDVETSWSIKNYLCCYYCGCYWKIMQLIRGKSYDLKDAVHKCSQCKKELGRYEAC